MFITFEGIDFCGKSTQVSLLFEYLKNQGRKIKIIREPGGARIPEKIRELLLDKKNNEMSVETELLLFTASRAQLVREVVIPSIEQGYYVISDRFHDSTVAYQGFGRGLPKDFIERLQKFAIGGAIPDVTFFIDITIEESIRRKTANMLFEPDRIESMQSGFFEKVREGYYYLAEKEKRFVVLDGSLPVEELHKKITGTIKEIEDLSSENNNVKIV